MLPRFIVAALLLSSRWELTAASQLLEEVREDRVANILVVSGLLQAGMDVALAEASIRRYLNRASPSIAFAEVTVFEKQEDRDVYGRSIYSNPCRNYQECRDRYIRSADAKGAIAAMLWSRSGAVLRFRDAGGNVSRRVLHGTDPSIIVEKKQSYEIAKITLSGAAVYFGNRRWVNVYLHTSAPLDSDRCESVTRRLAETLGVDLLSTTIRNDYLFFVHTESFPVRYAFSVDSVFPTEIDLSGRKTMRCVFDRKPRKCFVMP